MKHKADKDNTRLLNGANSKDVLSYYQFIAF